VDAFKSSLEQEFKKHGICDSPMVRVGATVRAGKRITEAGIDTVVASVELPGFYTQIAIGEPDRNNGREVDITTWPMETSTKQETIELSDIVGFRLTFSSPVFCSKAIRVPSVTHPAAANLIAVTAQRQVEILQAVEQLQSIIKSIIPTKGS